MPKDDDPKDSAAEGDAGGDNPDDNPGTDKSKNLNLKVLKGRCHLSDVG